jgi:hypothetical protein
MRVINAGDKYVKHLILIKYNYHETAIDKLLYFNAMNCYGMEIINVLVNETIRRNI